MAPVLPIVRLRLLLGPILLLFSSLLAGQPGENRRLLDAYEFFDVREIKLAAERRQLQLASGTQGWRHSFAPLTRLLALEEVDTERMESLARHLLLTDNVGGLTAPGVSLELTSLIGTPRGELFHLVFTPQYLGIPYFDEDTLVHLGRTGEVLLDLAAPNSRKPKPVQPRLGALAAARAALQWLSPSDSAEVRLVFSEAGPEQKSRIAGDSFLEPATARLVWFRTGNDVRLSWETYLHLGPDRWYCTVVDATDGNLLFSQNLYRREGRPRASVFRVRETSNPGHGLPTLENLTGLPLGHDCPPPIYPVVFRSVEQRFKCWVSGNESLGNNVSACLDRGGRNFCERRAEASNGNFVFPFQNSYETSSDPAPDQQAAITNAFYWVNAIHDWLYGLGFDESAGNFQANNFGRPGEAGDAVRLDVQDGAISENANFATPPDGMPPRLQLGLFPSVGRDSAFDGDVIVHEYAHGLTARLVAGPANVTGLRKWHSGALSEGWSDAYAVSFTGQPVFGEYVSGTPATGLRSVAYDRSPYTFGRFGTVFSWTMPGREQRFNLPQTHADGEIWATVLWDLRAALGRESFELLVTTALKLTPPRPSMLDARDAILKAAGFLSLGGEYQCEIWPVFAMRGFGASAALNHIEPGRARDTALSVYEAFDQPAACGRGPWIPGRTLFHGGAEAGSAQWTMTGLWHPTERRSAAGQKSWWFGSETTGTYNTGAPTSGSLTSPVIDLRSLRRAVLEWDQFLKGEGFGVSHTIWRGPSGPYLNFDSGWLLMREDGESNWQTLTTLAHNAEGETFARHRINLSRFAGKRIQLRFYFDTIDGMRNGQEGWYVDNVRVAELRPAVRRVPRSRSSSLVKRSWKAQSDVSE